MEDELHSFHGIFGMTTTFGKRCRHPTVGDTKYLQHLDIINVVIPAAPEAIEVRKGNGVILHFDGKDLVVKVHYHKYIYNNMTRMSYPCPVLKAAIAYSATVAAADHGASALQIESLFHVNGMILEIAAVQSDHVEAAVISPAIQMGEIIIYNREFVAEQVREYICLM